MKKVRFFKLIYNNIIITLGYCKYKNFKWSCSKIDGNIILTINNNYSLKDKRKIIYEVMAQI